MSEWTEANVGDITQEQYTKMTEDEYDALPEEVQKKLEEMVKEGKLEELISEEDAKKLEALLEKIADEDTPLDDADRELLEWAVDEGYVVYAEADAD